MAKALFSRENLFCSSGAPPPGLNERGGQTRPVFFCRLWAGPLVTARRGGGWRLPVCQSPTSLVHFDIHMGAVMILKAAIKLTVAFPGKRLLPTLGFTHYSQWEYYSNNSIFSPPCCPQLPSPEPACITWIAFSKYSDHTHTCNSFPKIDIKDFNVQS